MPGTGAGPRRQTLRGKCACHMATFSIVFARGDAVKHRLLRCRRCVVIPSALAARRMVNTATADIDQGGVQREEYLGSVNRPRLPLLEF